MTAHPPAIFFLSDYGTEDEFVGVVHAVIHRLAPGVAVIDLSHQVAPFDVAAGAAMLERSVAHLGPGVVLAVVDPGVGTHRRAVAVAVAGPSAGDPAGEQSGGRSSPGWLVGPDNGLLVAAAAALGGPVRVVELGSVGSTFDGRDLFGPAAAHLAIGGDPALLGPDADPGALKELEPRGGRAAAGRGDVRGGSVLVSVGWIDRFGNVQLRLTPDVLAVTGIEPGGSARVTVRADPADPADPSVGSGGGDDVDDLSLPTGPVPARWVAAFGDLAAGELGLLTDAAGSMSLVIDQGSAADRLGIAGPRTRIEIAVDRGGAA